MGGLFNLGAAALMAPMTGGTSLAGSLFSHLPSDRRLKKDVALIGREADGLGRYRFRYVWEAPDAPEREGVMAQEVATLRPEALVRHDSGFLAVDYGRL